MANSVFVVLKVGGLKTYKGNVHSVWGSYNEAVNALENEHNCKRNMKANGIVYTNYDGEIYRLVEKVVLGTDNSYQII